MAIDLDELVGLPAPKPQPNRAPSAEVDLDEIVGVQAAPAPAPSPAPSAPGPVDLDELVGARPAENESPAAPVAEVFERGAQGAMKLVEPLSYPLRAATGVAARAIPGAAQALNPKGDIIPDATFVDVSEYLFDRYLGKDEELLKNFISKGYDANTSAKLLMAYKKIPAFAAGLMADFVLDPIGLAKFGTAGKAGRNILEIRRPALPFIEKADDVGRIAIPAKPVVDAGKKLGAAVDRLAEKPVVGPAVRSGQRAAESVSKVASDLVEAFNWRTGDEVIDRAASELSAVKRGIPIAGYQEFFEPYLKRGFSDIEDQLITKVEENVSNLKPNIPISRELKETEKLVLGKDELALRMEADAKLRQVAAKDGVTLDPRRAEAIVDQVVDNKRMSAKVLENRFAAGKLDPEQDLATQIIENYFTHKADPRAIRKLKKQDKGLAAVMEQEELLSKDAEQALRTSGLTKYDPGAYRRKIRKDVFEANAELERATGIKQFFIENSTIAGLMRLNESRALVANRRFIDTMESKGIKFVERKRQNGSWERLFDAPQGLEKVANKVNYWFVPREQGNLAGYLNAYNRIFRSTVLVRPDYYLQNWMEGLLKNYAQGVKLSDYVDASKALSGKGMIDLNGKLVPARELRMAMDKWGVAHSSANETALFNQTVAIAKKLSGQGMKLSAKETARDLYRKVQDVGVRGENWVREAMFINRLKRGFSPQEAVFDLEKFHFDFSRGTKAMDTIRLFSPFIQAPVKTAFIAGELVGSNPRAFNFVQNQFMNSLERAFNDPTGADALYELSPAWRKFRDPSFGPSLSDLLGGNSWIVAIARNQAYQKSQGLPTDQMSFYLPVGLDILNPLAVWESQTLKQGALSGPVTSALATLLFGIDPFTGRSIDIDKNAPRASQRFAEAGKNLLISATGFPNTLKAIQQAYRVPDPEYFTPNALLVLQGSMGKFMRLDNVDREFLAKVKVLDGERRRLYRDFLSSVTREWQGRTNALAASGESMPIRELADKLDSVTSRDIWAEYLGKTAELGRSLAARDYLNSKDPKALAATLRGINTQIRELNENYVVVRQALLQAKRQGLEDSQIEAEAVKAAGLEE